MKTTSEQDEIIDRLYEANKKLKIAKIEARDVGRRAELDYIAGFQAINDQRAAEAFEAGIPVKQIAERGMGTTNHKSARESIEAGRRFIPEKPTVQAVDEPVTLPDTPRFQSYAPNGALVTLQPAEFEPFKNGLPDGIPDEEQDWVFYLEGGALKPADEDGDETWLHPVVKVVMNTPMKAEVIEFIETQARG